MKIFMLLSLFILISCQAEVYNDIYWNDDDTASVKEKISEDEKKPVFDRDDEKPNKINIIEE